MVLGLGVFGALAGSVMVHAQWTTPTPPAGWFGNTADVWGQFGLAGWTSGSTSMTGLITGFINWVLGLLSLIALVICLYGGFKMVTAAGDDAKYKEGFKILKQAAIGLIVIGLSWIIVSTIFKLIGNVSTGSTGTV